MDSPGPKHARDGPCVPGSTAHVGTASWAGSIHRDLPACLQDPRNRRSSQIERDEAQPVFRPSADRRAGLTLMPRMIVKNNAHILIWGEIYSRCDILRSLPTPLRAFTTGGPPPVTAVICTSIPKTFWIRRSLHMSTGNSSGRHWKYQGPW